MDNHLISQFFLILYPFVTAVSLSGYGPQILRLINDPRAAESYALSSWIMWASASFIATGYTYLRVNDTLLTLATFGYFILNLTIVALVIYNRAVRLRPAAARMAAPVNV